MSIPLARPGSPQQTATSPLGRTNPQSVMSDAAERGSNHRQSPKAGVTPHVQSPSGKSRGTEATVDLFTGTDFTVVQRYVILQRIEQLSKVMSLDCDATKSLTQVECVSNSWLSLKPLVAAAGISSIVKGSLVSLAIMSSDYTHHGQTLRIALL